MKNHIMLKHRNDPQTMQVVEFLLAKDKKRETIAAQNGSQNVLEMIESVNTYKRHKHKEYIQDLMDQNIAMWIAAENQCFNIVESSYFRDIFTSFQQKFNFEIKSADYYKKQVGDLYLIYLERIKTYLGETDSKISFSIDCWTSPNMDRFMSITAHFVSNDFEIKSLVLDSIKLEKRQTGSCYLAQVFLDSVSQFDLENRIGSITMDDFVYNKQIGKEICKILDRKSVQFSEKQCLPCFDHVINLAVQDFLLEMEPKRTSLVQNDLPFETDIDTNTETGIIGDGFSSSFTDLEQDSEDLAFYEDEDNFINKLRKGNFLETLKKGLYTIKNSVYMSSQLRINQLRSNLSVTNIIVDINTRWNSCLYMLDWSYKNKEALIQTLPDLIRLDWDLVNSVATFLQTFEIYIQNYSMEKSITIGDILMDYNRMIENARETSNNSNSSFCEAKQACLAKLENDYIYFEHPVYFISTCKVF